MTTMRKPFPWDPAGFINPRIEHLFRPKYKVHHRTGLPPKPASNITINPSNHAHTARISKARI